MAEDKNADGWGWSGGDDLPDMSTAPLIDTNLAEGWKPEIHGDNEDSFVVSLRQLKDQLGTPDDARVVYPGSSTHAGVARVFGIDKVIHVDPDESAMQALAEAGYQTEALPIEEFSPASAKYDGMVALNSYGVPTKEIISRIVKSGGFIIANNYSGWASELSNIEGVELVMAMLPAYSGDDRKIYKGDDIPENATGSRPIYLKVVDGRVSTGTAEDNDIADSARNHPDGLFVFKLLSDAATPSKDD